MMVEYDYIKYNIEPNGIAVLSIAAPKVLNALSRPVLEDLNRFIDTQTADLSLLVIRGEGEKSFVAGADISQMAPFSENEALDFGRFGAEVFRKIEELPIPVIAAVNGFALGGGAELAMACDIRIASSNAKFGQPEVKLGIIPGFSGTVRMAKLIGQGYAKELIYSGRTIDAAEALRIGLVNHVVEPQELMEYVMKLAGEIVANAPIAVRYAKKSINANYDLSTADGIELENNLFAKCFNTDDQKEGMKAFLSKVKPNFKNK